MKKKRTGGAAFYLNRRFYLPCEKPFGLYMEKISMLRFKIPFI